jgi:hypothetical protein
MSETSPNHVYIIPDAEYKPGYDWTDQKVELHYLSEHWEQVRSYLVAVALGAFRRHELNHRDVEDIATQGISYMDAKKVAKLGYESVKARRQTILEGAEQGHLTTEQVIKEFNVLSSLVPIDMEPAVSGTKAGFFFLNSMGLEIEHPREGYSLKVNTKVDKIQEAVYPDEETAEACQANDVEFAATQYELVYYNHPRHTSPRPKLMSERKHVSLGKFVPLVRDDFDRENHLHGIGPTIYEPFVTVLSQEYLDARNATLTEQHSSQE